MNFELRHLRYFVAVAEAENISRASRRLHISQPPLSRQIRDLEEDIGVTLFSRSPKRLELTDAGRVFLYEARAILERVEGAAAHARQVAKRDRSCIRIGHSVAASVQALPYVLRQVQRHHGDIRVELRTMTTEQMIRGLRRGELDMCLSVYGAIQDLREFVVTPLDTYSLVAGMPKHHPLVALPRVSIEDLVRQPIISLSETVHPWFNAYIRDVLSVHGSSYEVVEEHDSDEGVLAAVEAGRGITLLYDVMAHVVGKRVSLKRLSPAPRRVPLVLFHRSEFKAPLQGRYAHSKELQQTA